MKNKNRPRGGFFVIKKRHPEFLALFMLRGKYMKNHDYLFFIGITKIV
jgi:hypothetical protein